MQTVIAVEDRNGSLICRFVVKTDGCMKVEGKTSASSTTQIHICPKSASLYALNSGVPFSFTTTCEVTKDYTNGTLRGFLHTIKGYIKEWIAPNQASHHQNAVNWNFGNAKVYIGGYRQGSGTSFTGCMSAVVAQNKDVIATYFSQSPSSHTSQSPSIL